MHRNSAKIMAKNIIARNDLLSYILPEKLFDCLKF